MSLFLALVLVFSGVVRGDEPQNTITLQQNIENQNKSGNQTPSDTQRGSPSSSGASQAAADANATIAAQQNRVRQEEAYWTNVVQNQKDLNDKINAALQKQLEENTSQMQKDYLKKIQLFKQSQNPDDLPINLIAPDKQIRILLGNIYSDLFALTPKNPNEKDLKTIGFGLVRESDTEYSKGHRDLGLAASKMALMIVDVFVGLVPGVGESECIYVMFTGFNPVLQENVGPWGRALAVAGVLTAGYAYKFGEGVTVFSKMMTMVGRDERVIVDIAKNATVAHDLVAVTMRGEDPRIMADILETSRDLVRHDLYNPGELHSLLTDRDLGTVAETFRGGSYLGYTTREPIKLYRIFDPSKGSWVGSYWTRVPPTGALRSQIENAIDLSFSGATHMVEMEVPAGTKIYEGVSSGLVKKFNNISQFPGGADQVFLKVDPGWAKKISPLK